MSFENEFLQVFRSALDLESAHYKDNWDEGECTYSDRELCISFVQQIIVCLIETQILHKKTNHY